MPPFTSIHHIFLLSLISTSFNFYDLFYMISKIVSIIISTCFIICYSILHNQPCMRWKMMMIGPWFFQARLIGSMSVQPGHIQFTWQLSLCTCNYKLCWYWLRRWAEICTVTLIAHCGFIWCRNKKNEFRNTFKFVLSTTPRWQRICNIYSKHHKVWNTACIICFNINCK